jgi:hypothetical protein
MFPNETLDGRIVRDSFVGSANRAIFGFQTFYRSVVNVRNSDVRNFGLKDISDVVMKYGY